MNKMLISLFVFVSLLAGSSFATAPAPHYFAFDGCTDVKQPKQGQGWKEGDLRPGYFDGTTEAAQIVCCDSDGKCSRKLDGACRSAAKVTWSAAKEHCEADGKRLCATQAELDGCCVGGCGYDNKLVWSSNLLEVIPSMITPGIPPECLVFPDCSKGQWCNAGKCVKCEPGQC